MKKIKMTDDTLGDEIGEREFDFALAYNPILTDSNIRSQFGEYDASVVINHDHPHGKYLMLTGHLISYLV